jgi:uncharacterized membrane protein
MLKTKKRYTQNGQAIKEIENEMKEIEKKTGDFSSKLKTEHWFSYIFAIFGIVSSVFLIYKLLRYLYNKKYPSITTTTTTTI